MPRVNLGKKEPDKLQLLFGGYIAANGVSRAEVGEMLGSCPNTTREKLRHPDDMTIGQAKRLAKRLGISLDEFRAAIHY